MAEESSKELRRICQDDDERTRKESIVMDEYDLMNSQEENGKWGQGGGLLMQTG